MVFGSKMYIFSSQTPAYIIILFTPPTPEREREKERENTKKLNIIKILKYYVYNVHVKENRKF